jgi:sulfoxide reductase catalytic subunit YedY
MPSPPRNTSHPAAKAANSFEDITQYNNFLRVLDLEKRRSSAARNFVTRPWTGVGRRVGAQTKNFRLDDLVKLAPPEERVYRMRCVEAWSMVIPWLGFPLARLLEQVEPMSNAKYVKFITLYDPKRMPNQFDTDVLPWPYQEGLRLDEAMHPLTLLATGFTANHCCRKTARRYVWSCRGSMASKASSQSCKSS